MYYCILFNLCVYISGVMRFCFLKNSYLLFLKYLVFYKIEDKEKWLGFFFYKKVIVFS